MIRVEPIVPSIELKRISSCIMRSDLIMQLGEVRSERGKTMSNEVGFNQEFLRLKMRYEALKEQCASKLELYTHLVEVKGPNIKARYMMLVGQYEHQVFELKAEIARWKRRFA